jgi:MinD-like ATPase involved in chromosome partitioning or flagellar assembly
MTTTNGTHPTTRGVPMPDPDRTMSVTVFPGAARVQQYPETPTPPDVTAPEAALVPERPRERATPASRPASPARATVATGGWTAPAAGPVTAITAPVKPGHAQWGWRGRFHRGSGGLLTPAPGPAELAHRDAIATIGSTTWPRAVNVIVTNPKGGSGKTPTSVILAGVLGQIRGGSVVAWEASEAAGTLTTRAEGTPLHGLGELVAGTREVRSAGNLAGFTTPQTSHADVIGSVSARRTLTGWDVLMVRQVLDTYYRITVTDTGNNLTHPAYLAALHTADAVVVPCLPSIDALTGLEQVGEVMRAAGGHVADRNGLLSRVVVVLGHDGGPENPRVAAAVRERLTYLGLAVVEVPFDPTIRDGGPITLASLSEESSRAWTAVAAAVVTALRSAPTATDLVAQATQATIRTHPAPRPTPGT